METPYKTYKPNITAVKFDGTNHEDLMHFCENIVAFKGNTFTGLEDTDDKDSVYHITLQVGDYVYINHEKDECGFIDVEIGEIIFGD